MQPSEEIKTKLDIVNVIREYIQLKAAGVNFKANCPFHREKTPSFVVSPEKQIWHCFGCGKGGDVFSFVQEMEGLTFIETLHLLAPKAGVILKKFDPAQNSERLRILSALDLARKYYFALLYKNGDPQGGLSYLKKRGLTDEIIEEWQIGYSLDNWNTLGDFLKKQGVAEKDVYLAGLSIKKEGLNKFYDRFRGRIMFPINDVNGNTVAFSARIDPLKEKLPGHEKMGKYINSPQTQVYDKSKILFGLDKAKQEIKKQNYAILVEGQMDAITAHQFGFKNTIAASGTALTEEQVNLLKRYSQNIALAFDMDEAGGLATDRGVREAMKAEMNIKVIIIPRGKDPDECIRQDIESWKTALRKAKPLMQYYFDKFFKDFDRDNISQKREATKKMLNIIVKLGNKIEQDHWIGKLANIINIKEEILRETLNSLHKNEERENLRKNLDPQEIKNKQTSREEKLSELLITLILKFFPLTEYALNNIEIDYLDGLENRRIYRSLVFYYNINRELFIGSEEKEAKINYSNLREWLNEELSDQREKESQLSRLDRLVILSDENFYNYDFEKAKKEITNAVNGLKKSYLTKRMKEIENLIAETEKQNDEDKLGSLIEEFKLLSEELKELKI